MKIHSHFLTWLVLFIIIELSLAGCNFSNGQEEPLPAANSIDQYITLLRGKRVGLVVNQTSVINTINLTDTLLSLGINIVEIFSPEHGFKGNTEAGADVSDQKYCKNNIPIISLYGNKKKPSDNDLKDLDIVVFDIQDVGVRFYTYLSTLHYAMEACAENNIQLILLDRPNPNGFYIDGPVLVPEFRSFIGMHPVPVVYGMTIGEYALMINGEYWLKDSIKCNLKVIPCSNYSHNSFYNLPVSPSPNLKEMKAIYLYPSTAFFEGTVISEGRGTDSPFMIAGHPDYPAHNFSFTPKSIIGVSDHPKFEGAICYGIDLRCISADSLKSTNHLQLNYLLSMFKNIGKGSDFFTSNFDLLAGTDKLRKDILDGKNEDEIRQLWKKPIAEFEKIRVKYLLYPDFK